MLSGLFRLLLFIDAAAAILPSIDACDSKRSSVFKDLNEKQVIKGGHGNQIFAFDAPQKDFTIVVTPEDNSSDPDLRLYASSEDRSCQSVLSGQEMGGDYLLVTHNLTEQVKASRYFLHVFCTQAPENSFAALEQSEGCIQPLGQDMELKLTDSCDLSKVGLLFEVLRIDDDRFILKHYSGKCVWPAGHDQMPDDGTGLVLDSDCSNASTFVIMPSSNEWFVLQHSSGKCVHPSADKASVGSKLVLRKGCDVESGSQIFKWRQEDECKYHLSFTQFQSDELFEEIEEGEVKTGIAYHGIASHFIFHCDESCENNINAGKNNQITFSAWPRDATSTKHLTLLVRHGDSPTTDSENHLTAASGWFSGEVIAAEAKPGPWYITVLKRHGLSPMPFLLTVKLPETLQRLDLGTPVFGAVSRESMAFFKFFVKEPNTDIEVYITGLDGNPDVSLSHADVNQHPSHLSSQWTSRMEGDDEIIVLPDDPKRLIHPTGWFHIGVEANKDSTFSIIALVVERHIDNKTQASDSQQGVVISWTELWLGLPQVLAAQPGRPANFLFYSQLATPKLFVTVEALEGRKPDTCVTNCGPDPHYCPYLSPFSARPMLAGHSIAAISTCDSASMRGYNAETEATILNPCTNCWYAMIVTSAENRSKFKIRLGADGRAHPLVDGEPFRGHVDSQDSCVLLVYDLSKESAESHGQVGATLEVALTGIYGDPSFVVTRTPEDATPIFSSKASGHDIWRLKIPSSSADSLAGLYYFKVCAEGTHHAHFQIQVSWDKITPNSASSGKLTDLGTSFLFDGMVQHGSVSSGRQQLYLYHPGVALQESDKPSIQITATASGDGGIRFYVIAIARGGGEVNVTNALRKFESSPEAEAQWTMATDDGQSELVIRSTDKHYLAPTSTWFYAILVAAGEEVEKEDQLVPFEIIAAVEDSLEELPTNGIPLSGTVELNEYRRYVLVIPEELQKVSIVLTTKNGDSDLFVGLTADVTSENARLRSANIGSDSVFISPFSELSKNTCSEKAIKHEIDECVHRYYVAVKGVSQTSDYEISASVAGGAPFQLALSEERSIVVPGGMWQLLYIKLQKPPKPMTLEVSVQTGEVSKVNLKVTELAEAKHPSSLLDAQVVQEADIKAVRFAGVWSIKFIPAVISKLCEWKEACAAFIGIHTMEGFSGTLALVAKDTFDAHASGGDSLVPTADCLELKGGNPFRGDLEDDTQQLCVFIRIPTSKTDVAVTVSPLASCKPEVKAFQTSNTWTLRADPRLGFVSQIIRKEELQIGRLYFKVSQSEPSACKFDIRAQLIEGGSQAQFNEGGQGEMQALVLDSPAYTRGEHVKYFYYDASLQDAKNAKDRANLEIAVTALTGELQVACGTFAAGDEFELTAKSQLLLAAFQDLKIQAPESARGAAQSFICRGQLLQEGCKTALHCQLLVRIRSSRPGRVCDFLAVVSDRTKSSRFEVLSPGIPSEGCLGKTCPNGRSAPVRYQLFINNPAAKVKLRLSCRGPEKKTLCQKVLLSADSRQDFPEEYTTRAYTSTSLLSTGSLELQLRGSEKDHSGAPGVCEVPCILFVSVDVEEDAPTNIRFEIAFNIEESYSLLLDGHDPVTFTAQPSQPEYFLFDSRRPSPLLTLITTVPYDDYDPHGSLVNMYVVDCAKPEEGGQAKGEFLNHPSNAEEDPNSKPSAEFYRYRGYMNPRGQLVAMIGKGIADTKDLDEGHHCYYRIAIISTRPNPVTLSVRGFDWHQGTPLTLGEPVEGVVDGSHRFSFELAEDEVAENILVTFEVCAGSVRLQSSPDAPWKGNLVASSQAKSLDVSGSFYQRELPWKYNRWFEVSSRNGKFGSYILSIQDPLKQIGLEALNGLRDLTVAQKDGVATISWHEAKLFGHGRPASADGEPGEGDAEYEVFFRPISASASKDDPSPDFSQPCGLYLEFRLNRASRESTRTDTFIILQNLIPGKLYIINVVARSLQTGHSMAYNPWKGVISRPSVQSASWMHGVASGSSSYLGMLGYGMLIASSFGLFAWLCCSQSGARLFSSVNIELPDWSGRSPSSHYSSFDATGRRIGGAYVPPAL